MCDDIKSSILNLNKLMQKVVVSNEIENEIIQVRGINNFYE